MKKDNDLKQIKDLIEIVKHKVDLMEASKTGELASIHLIKDQQSVMNEKLTSIRKDLDEVKDDLKEVKQTQQSHTGSLMSIEATLNGYADAYKVNKVNIERLDERVAKLEDNAGIIPPSDLVIQR